MELPDDPSASVRSADGLALLERSLRRALATSESAETRYHIRTALQSLEVLRETNDGTDQSADVSLDSQ